MFLDFRRFVCCSASHTLHPLTFFYCREFPSLSNSSQLVNSGQASLWSTAGSRNIGGQAIQRGANTPLSSQQSQQEDMFGASARLQSNQGSFRFGSQANIGQATIGQASIGQASIGQPAPSSQPGSIDDFPPLNRSANAGEIGQDRTASLMSSLGYGSQASATSPVPQGGAGGGRSMGNGLLNALSANSGSRVSSGGGEVRSPVGTRPQETRSLAAEEEAARQKQDNDAASASAAAAAAAAAASAASTESPIGEAGGPPRDADGRSSIGTIGGGDGAHSGKQREESEATTNTGQDPLAGTAPIDRWGMKGLRSLLNNPEYSAMISGFGLDLNTLGVDLSTNE